MYYFIPAWYGSERIWHNTTTPWYWSKDMIEFDETIHQIRVFQEAGVERKLVLPHYCPQLRYYLHRQDLLETDYLSIFDHIQGISPRQEMIPVQVEDLEWPAQTSFAYTPFQIVAFCRGQVIASIDLGVDGNLLSVNRLKGKETVYVQYLDDRGFISSVLYYKEGSPYFQDYLTPEGDWVLRELLTDASHMVFVNEAFQKQFKRETYSDMGEVVAEKMKAILEDLVPGHDRMVIAAHPANLSFIQQVERGVSKVLSFYGQRQPLSQEDSLLHFSLKEVDLVLADSEKTKQDLLRLAPSMASKVHRLTSFDSRLRLGRSQERKESKIFFYLDEKNLPSPSVLEKMFEILAKKPLFEVIFATYNASDAAVATLDQQLEDLAGEMGMAARGVQVDSRELGENHILEDASLFEKKLDRYKVQNFFHENDIIKELEQTRLIVDMSEEPNLYTQIAGISAGIPQINRTQTEYVDHLKNGYVLGELEEELEKAMDYFLRDLKPWNESLIYSVEKIQEYTGQRLIAKWEGWMEN